MGIRGSKLGNQILSLFTVLPLSLLLSDADWKADSVAICCASALFAPFGRRLESRFCRYLLCFRSLCCFWAPTGKQILSLFAVLPSALFAAFWRRLESRFCRYLLCFRSLCCFCVPTGKHILLLFAVLPLSLLLFGRRLDRIFCRYLRCFRSLGQGQLWWRLVAILTCKSFVILGSRGERLIDLSSSWFHPKFPSGWMELRSFIR